MTISAALWHHAATEAAQQRDWAAALHILEMHRADWPEEPAFLLNAANWLRMAGHGDRANEALLRAAALEDSFGIAEEAHILEITPARPPPPPASASLTSAAASRPTTHGVPERRSRSPS